MMHDEPSSKSAENNDVTETKLRTFLQDSLDAFDGHRP